MPLGSRFVAFSALIVPLGLAGCNSAPKPASQPLRASVKPTADARPAARSSLPAPVVQSADFQKTPAPVATASPGLPPAIGVPTIPTTTSPAPIAAEPVPPPAPGIGLPTTPPIAQTNPSDTGGIVMPSLTDKK